MNHWSWPRRWNSNHRAAESAALLIFLILGFVLPIRLPAQALERYVRAPDAHYAWEHTGRAEKEGCELTEIALVSQKWRDHVWQHQLLVVRPSHVRHADIAFLFITGDGRGEKYFPMLKILAERGGAVAAILNKVPNQPLYDGRKEDALIAYTFLNYLETGDETWPLLFPMVKSAVRAMDTVQTVMRESHGQAIERFVVSGASKRGWTTWLTGAVDPRVAGIAPMVIDMLNMKAQLDWAEKVYGRQSEEIEDYTRLKLHLRMDEPPMIKLRRYVDPYSYRERYTMPKLLLLGTNDPYWTVDSLRHYWDDLPEPKLIYQTPNAGHGLNGGQEATQTLAAFFRMIAEGRALPKFDWSFQESPPGATEVKVTVNRPAESIKLWTATSADRDFRDEEWSSRELPIGAGSSRSSATLSKPEDGYRAYLLEATLLDDQGHPYKLSTEARVTPDGIR